LTARAAVVFEADRGQDARDTERIREPEMTDRERFVRTLTGQPVDRVPFMKIFGQENRISPNWEEEYPGIGGCIDDLLGFEGVARGWGSAPVNCDLARTGPVEIVEETENTITRRFRTGKVEMVHKGGDYNRHTVAWPVTDRASWDRLKAEHLDPDDPSRFPGDWADWAAARRDRTFPLQLTHRGVYGFPREVVGDEALAYLFYDAPELVHDILDAYTSMCLAVWERMTADVDFDLIECWEDMAYRSGSLVSPKTFREFLKPQYERIAAFARDHGIPIVLVDSDGLVEELTGLMAESGVTAMYPYEVQSGNDVARVRRQWPEFACIGGLDKQVMTRGRDAIDREIDRARDLIRLGRVIPGPDHFVLKDVTFEAYRYFMERLREVVMTSRPG
jgi:uroporphyrinogen decarboxylase